MLAPSSLINEMTMPARSTTAPRTPTPVNNRARRRSAREGTTGGGVPKPKVRPSESGGRHTLSRLAALSATNRGCPHGRIVNPG